MSELSRRPTNQAQDTLFFHISLLLHLCVSLVRLTLSSRPYSPLCNADPDRPSATSIETTTGIRAAIGTARLAYIMRVTSELLAVARAAYGLCLKDTCMDERDD